MRELRADISTDGKLMEKEATALSHAELAKVDHLHLTIHPVILGDGKRPTLTGLPGGYLPHSLHFKPTSMRVEGKQCHMVYQRMRSPEEGSAQAVK